MAEVVCGVEKMRGRLRICERGCGGVTGTR